MAKNPTNWSNNDVKAPQSWGDSGVKSTPSWSNNIAKAVTTFTNTPKNTDAWGINYGPNQNYFYDDVNMTYNSALWNYDSLINFNQANQKLQTRWGAN